MDRLNEAFTKQMRIPDLKALKAAVEVMLDDRREAHEHVCIRLG